VFDEIVRDRSLQARGVYGFWPASSDGDDIVVHDGNYSCALRRVCRLRRRSAYGDSRPNRSLADYVGPAGAGDFVGAFAVTAGIGAEGLAARFEAEHDDYHAIIVKALADRLAEAFAEYLHEVARHEWYESGPKLTNEQLIEERYRGIRPAFGYPACPDHTEKRKLFDLLGAEELGLVLTESYATLPAASVSGIYLGHPQARYFSVGRIGRDQVEDYAARKGLPVAEAERWLTTADFGTGWTSSGTGAGLAATDAVVAACPELALDESDLTATGGEASPDFNGPGGAYVASEAIVWSTADQAQADWDREQQTG